MTPWYKQPLPIHKIEKNLDLVPSDLNMSAAEVKMSGLFNREMRLTHILAKVKDSYDYVLIDCPLHLALSPSTHSLPLMIFMYLSPQRFFHRRE